MTSKSLLLGSLGMFAVLVSSCAPFIPYKQRDDVQAAGPSTGAPETIDAEEQKRLNQLRDDLAANTDPSGNEDGGLSELENGNGGGTGSTGQRPTYRYALQIPGKEGFVFNPFTNNPVDVRGIPSGTLVRDPQDNDANHKFRVP
jgi:hypothetical protein